MTLDAVDSFTYIGSTIESNLSLDAEINTRIAKAAAVMSKLNRRVWQNNMLTQISKGSKSLPTLHTILHQRSTSATILLKENQIFFYSTIFKTFIYIYVGPYIDFF